MEHRNRRIVTTQLSKQMLINGLLEILDMAKTAKAKKNIREKTSVCKCLICESQSNPRRRGLCDLHYHQFDNAKRKLPKRKQEDFDRDQVRAGRILKSRRGNQAKSPNPFVSN